ncbi:VanZ family protein [Streptomyces sp. Y1]|uniref:VanZ family protein n=1 Tax=Streptomyces sp. Y1 TaxID=3238634 RepID=A0AB39TRX1_9ACTN
MIEAALDGTPALFPVFAVLGLLLGAGAGWLARRRGAPVAVAVLWGLSLAGELAVTLTPTTSEVSGRATCAIGASAWNELLATQGKLNIALFVPLAAFGVLLFRRPVTVLAGCAVLSAGTEAAQALLRTGRACDATDFLDNTAGAVLGVLLGVGWLMARRARPAGSLRDLWQGAVVGGVGLAAVGLVLHLGVRVYSGDPGLAAPPSDDIVTAQRVAEGLFGPQARVSTTTSSDPTLPPQVMDVTTDRGTFRIEQPSGRLLAAAAEDDRAGAALAPEQVVAAGTAFAQTWFADRIAGLTPVVTPAGSNGADRRLSYRRPADPAGPAGAAAVRVDVTVSAAGRVLAAEAS